MKTETRIATYSTYWAYYISQHQRPDNWALHYLGRLATLAVTMNPAVQHRLITLLSAIMLLVGVGCTETAREGALNGLEWTHNLLAKCVGQSCFVAVGIAPLAHPTAAIVGAVSAELRRAETAAYPCGRSNPKCEGLVADTNHPAYAAVSSRDLIAANNSSTAPPPEELPAHRAHRPNADRRGLASGLIELARRNSVRRRFAESEPKSQQMRTVDEEPVGNAPQSYLPATFLASWAIDKEVGQPGGSQSAATVPIGPSSARSFLALRKPSDNPAHDWR